MSLCANACTALLPKHGLISDCYSPLYSADNDLDVGGGGGRQGGREGLSVTVILSAYRYRTRSGTQMWNLTFPLFSIVNATTEMLLLFTLYAFLSRQESSNTGLAAHVGAVSPG